MRVLLLLVLVGSASDAKAQWETETVVDEMEETAAYYAYSPPTEPTRTLSPPYNNLRVKLVYACNSEAEWSYLYFNTSVNVQGEYDSNGAETFSGRIKWDDEIETYQYRSRPGSDTAHFTNGARPDKMMKHSRALVEVPWYGTESVYFDVSLTGSTAAINEIQAECNL